MKRLPAAVLAVLLPAAALAQDGVLVKVSGPVSVLAGGARRFVAAKGGEELIFGDTVKVGNGGVAHLTLREGGTVLLREESFMTLQGSRQKTMLRFRFGEFLIGLKKRLGPGQSFKVRTPAAVAAVRGTLFWGKADKADQSTTYAGFGHTVAVTAKDRTVLVTPGRTITVSFGEAPKDPVASAVGLDYVMNFTIDGSLQGLADLAETDKLKK